MSINTTSSSPILSGSRRQFLIQAGFGMGAVAAADILRADQPPRNPSIDELNPLAAREPHFPGKIKRVIH
ncbi:MAG: hypothetical protein KDA78_20205, partial [Planctomycetaceae bacterium]|nr:hypothetical protein [Planctomycetaceae bacterium]